MLEGVKLVSGVEAPIGGSEEGEPVIGVGWGGMAWDSAGPVSLGR